MRRLLSSPESESMTAGGLSSYSGAMYLSRVERYLTLSFASLSASVIKLLFAFHVLSLRLLHAVRTITTTWHSVERRSSQIELSFVARLRQKASSVRGPMSSPSPPSSFSSRSLEVASTHSVTTSSYLRVARKEGRVSSEQGG